MKRTQRFISAILVCFTLIVWFCPAALASTPTAADLNLTVDAQSETIVMGSNITVKVTAENKSASYSMDYLRFTLKYDRSILNCSSSSVTSDAAHSNIMAVDDASGIIVLYIADGSTTKKALAPGEKMEISFTFSPAVSTTTPVTVTFDDLQIYTRNDLNNSSINTDNIKHTFNVATPYDTLSMTFRTRSSNANLNTLSVKVDNVEKALSPAFSANVTAYTFSAEEPVGAVTITCTCQDQGAKYVQTQAGSVYTITVTAEDGTTKAYTITLQTVQTTTSTTTTTTAVPTTTTTIPTTSFQDNFTQPTDAGIVSDSTVVPEEDRNSGLLASVNISVLGLIGIVAGEIGLFMLAFLSGYMTHKNASRPAKISLEDLVAAHAQAEQEGYFDEMEQAEMAGDQPMMPEMPAEPFTPQFSAQVSFPTDGLGMPGGYDMGTGMDGMGMPNGYDMGAGMDGMGMPNGYDMGAGMDGMGTPNGYDMGAGMEGMGMPNGYDMGTGMDGMGMPNGYDMGAGMDGTGMPNGYDMNGMGTPPGYGM